MHRSPDRKFRPLAHSGRKRALVVSSGMLLLLLSTANTTAARNVILFVADGLRQGSVNNDDAPAMSQIRKEGVFFANSHALFPTLTTPNASAIATGHNLGDTGDFGNYLYAGFPLAVTICDAGLQQGQGMHGSFSRADTLNYMAPIGPDFKRGYVDNAPVSNADIAPTLAHILKLDLPANGQLRNRVIDGSLAGGPEIASFQKGIKESEASASGMKTRLSYENVGETFYFDAAGFDGRTVGLPGRD
jgi:arylsulfatase A-like enzyme